VKTAVSSLGPGLLQATIRGVQEIWGSVGPVTTCGVRRGPARHVNRGLGDPAMGPGLSGQVEGQTRDPSQRSGVVS